MKLPKYWLLWGLGVLGENGTGDVVASGDYSAYSQWGDVTPASIGESALEIVCARAPQQ